MYVRSFIIIFIFFLITGKSFALNIVLENNVEFHETSGVGILNKFVEDTSSLLPTDMLKRIKPNIETLIKSSDFTATYDYWKRNIVSKEKFKDSYKRIISEINSGASDYRIAEMLGETVRSIFEISMSTISPDPMNEIVQRNMTTYLNYNSSVNAKITYTGYKTESLDILVENLFALRRFQKNDYMYSLMVSATAQLWSHVWEASGKQVAQIPQEFIRRDPKHPVLFTAEDQQIINRGAYKKALVEYNEAIDKLLSYRENSFRSDSMVSKPIPTSTRNVSTYTQPYVTTYQPSSQPPVTTYQRQPSAEQTRKSDDVKNSAQEAITGGKWGK